jgi:hypothetical protein
MDCETKVSWLLNLRSHAIVLNNMGITLLEKNCYEQAIATLQDSLSIMQSITHRVTSREVNDTVGCDDYIHLMSVATNMHNHAIKRTSMPEPHVQKVANFESLYLSDACQSIDFEWPDTTTNGNVSQQVPFFRLIRLDGFQCDVTNHNYQDNYIITQEPEESHQQSFTETYNNDFVSAIIDLESAIILHNVGLAAYSISLMRPMIHTSNLEAYG